MINLLIVDDSLYYRSLIKEIVQDSPDINIVGSAGTGTEGYEKAMKLRPDVITMDVEMPGVNGIMAVKAIMKEAPCSIIMVSSHTDRNSQMTIDALSAGAVDFFCKQERQSGADLGSTQKILLDKIIHFGKSKPPVPRKDGDENKKSAGVKREIKNIPPDLVLIGSSAGGSPALLDLLCTIKSPLSFPLVIAQHMPDKFTFHLARRLESESGLNVIEGGRSTPLLPGAVTVLPGGKNSIIKKSANDRLVLAEEKSETICKPSIDKLLISALGIASNPVGIILSGMGDDGSAAVRLFAEKGFYVVIQTPEDSLIDGMPRSALEADPYARQLPAKGIGALLAKWSESRTIGEQDQ